MTGDPSAPGSDPTFPIDITDRDRDAGFVEGVIANIGGGPMPLGLPSRPATIRALVRPCGSGLFAVKWRMPNGAIRYAIFGERNGMIHQGAKADAAPSVTELE
jgi:hypothetical protein